MYRADKERRDQKGGTLTTYNIPITGLYAVGAGAVHVQGTYNMVGGSIQNNIGLGGVNVNGGTFNISGKIIIKGNSLRGTNDPERKVCDVYLPSRGDKITVAGALTSGSSVGVRTESNPAAGESIVLTEGFATNNSGVDPTDVFFLSYVPSYPKYKMVKTTDGEAALALHAHQFVLTADDDADTITVKCTNPYCEFGTGTEYTFQMRMDTGADDEKRFVRDNSSHGVNVTINPALPEDMRRSIYNNVTYAYTNPDDGSSVELGYNKKPYQVGDYTATLSVWPDGKESSKKTVQTSFSIIAPTVVKHESHVDIVPKTGLIDTDGIGRPFLATFTNWSPSDDTSLYVRFRVDAGSWFDDQGYYYTYMRTTNAQNSPRLYPYCGFGVHTIEYYIPENETHYAYGSEEEPLIATVIISKKININFKTEIPEGILKLNNTSPDNLVAAPGNTVTYTLPEVQYTSVVSHGYVFTGWKIGNEVKQPGETIEIDNDIDVWAVFQYSRRISRIEAQPIQGGSVSADKNETIPGETIQLTVTPNPGYRLESVTATYATDSSVTIPVSDDLTFVMPDDNVYITAVFTPICTVSFNPGGGSGEMEPVSMDPDTIYTLPSCGFTAPEEQGFKEWSVKIGNADAVIRNPDDRIKVTANTTVTAVWDDLVTAPVFSPAGGLYTEAQDVAITCATEGAEIHYTTDGTEPTAASTRYTAPIRVTGSTRIRAIAVKGTAVKTADATYTILLPGKAATPLFSPDPGTFTGSVSVTIESATDGADIYYTIDGTDPTTASTLYTGPITLTKTTTIKAFAVMEGLKNSAAAQATYTVAYAVTVANGTGSGEYTAGTAVTIQANDPPEGNRFKAWTGADGLTFTEGSADTATATFTMPAHAVEVTATYEPVSISYIRPCTFCLTNSTFVKDKKLYLKSNCSVGPQKPSPRRGRCQARKQAGSAYRRSFAPDG